MINTRQLGAGRKELTDSRADLRSLWAARRPRAPVAIIVIMLIVRWIASARS